MLELQELCPEQQITESSSSGKRKMDDMIKSTANEVGKKPHKKAAGRRRMELTIEEMEERKKKKNEKDRLYRAARKADYIRLKELTEIPALDSGNFDSQLLSTMKEENHQISSGINIITQHLMNIESENSVLRAQAEELRNRLVSLNQIICIINLGIAAASSMNMGFMNQPIMASPDLFQY